MCYTIGATVIASPNGNRPRVRADLPRVRARRAPDDAGRCVRLLPHVRRLRGGPQAPTGRLLRLLLLRLGAVPGTTAGEVPLTHRTPAYGAERTGSRAPTAGMPPPA